MFTNQLPDASPLFSVVFSDYAERYYRKDFRKKFKTAIWDLTEQSIRDDLARIGRDLQKTQQVDQLYHKDHYWIFKYDFSVVKSGLSPKKSGHRCICYLDSQKLLIQILLIYSKTHLPKAPNETQYLKQLLQHEFADYLQKLL